LLMLFAVSHMVYELVRALVIFRTGLWYSVEVRVEVFLCGLGGQ
jgi:hypothetical protein